MEIQTIAIRLTIAILMAGAIGYEREYHSRPAGLRTHIMVCVGAVILAMIQEQNSMDAIQFAVDNPSLAGVVGTDKSRIVAQVVSGVGFLGAGTIMIQKRSVYGLTTAATIWAVAALGLAIGLGYYKIGIGGFVAVIITLNFVKSIIYIPNIKKIKISYEKSEESRLYLERYFIDNRIDATKVEFYVTLENENKIYNDVYEIQINDMNVNKIIQGIASNDNILKARILDN